MSNFRQRQPVVPCLASVLLGLVSAAGLQPASASAAPVTCQTTTSLLDYDGDGYDDAAVGDPYATVDGQAEAGAVTVLLGTADGRIGSGGRTVITKASYGRSPQAGDHFGFDVVLAQADLLDLCADLLIGAPGEDVDGKVDAGVAYLDSRAADSEATPGDRAFVMTQAGAGGTVEAGDRLGWSVAVMDRTQEDPRRLVAGAPGEDLGAATDAGVIDIWRLDNAPRRLTELRQGMVAPLGAGRLPGTPQTGDRFGASLVAGLLDLAERDGLETAQGLVVGAPGDTVSGHDGAGSVTVLQEEFESVSLLTQDTAGVRGAAEKGDQFGFSLALSPVVAGRPRQLAVGSPGEDGGGRADTGSVTLFANTGERFTPRATFSQASAGVPGANERGDRFGHSLSFGQTATLLVGIPTEDIGSTSDAGAVQPVLVPPAPQPLAFRPALTEDAAGTPGSVAKGHRFGSSLGALEGMGEQILTVSSVYGGSGSVYVISDRDDTAPRSWLPGPGAGRFGWAVSN